MGNGLEVELEKRSETDGAAIALWHRYAAMKDFLSREYYPWVQANCPYYPDHAQGHVESVIQTASLLVGKLEDLTSLDLFLMLSAIVFHDAAMVYGRTEHHDQITRIMEGIRGLGFIDVTVQRLTEEIAKAHTGEKGLAIPRRNEDCTLGSTSFTVYPRALAAILRFADEVSETRSRVSQSLMSQVPQENRIYWDYAYCVSATKPDPARERVVVSVELHDDMPTRRYQCPDEFRSYSDCRCQISLVEYVVCRLQKMNRERAYCAPAFGRYSTIENLFVRMTALKGGSRVEGYEDEVVLGGDGLGQLSYPAIEIFHNFFGRYPRWQPDKLAEVMSR